MKTAARTSLSKLSCPTMSSWQGEYRFDIHGANTPKVLGGSAEE